jgi:hypothetical protein
MVSESNGFPRVPGESMCEREREIKVKQLLPRALHTDKRGRGLL